MSKVSQPNKQLGPRSIGFNALLLLDAFMLGGLVALVLVNQLLESTMDRLIKVDAQAEILNVLDHLIPYWVGYIGVSLLLGISTVGAYLWLRSRF